MPLSTTTSSIRSPRFARALGGLAAAFVLVTAVASATLSLTWPVAPVDIHVRWTTSVTEVQRLELERRFGLINGQQSEGTTWAYQLTDTSTANIRSLIQDERVDDTEHLNRLRYRPEFAQDRSRQLLVYSVAIGAVGSLALLVLAGRRTGWFRVSWSSALTAAVSSMLASARATVAKTDSVPITLPPYSHRTTAVALLAGLLIIAAMTTLAGASLWPAASAMVAVYVFGYVVGSLLVDPVDGLSFAVIRTIAGLLLTTIGFLLSLVLSLPWFLGPAVLVAAAVWLRRGAAFPWPQIVVRFRWDAVAAAVLAFVLVSPIIITVLAMAPGRFPPVFYNIDTAYHLEKVHALAAATTDPPPSLSNVGIQRTYHYGTQAMAALISRSSGLLPHHAMFVIVLPLLTIGVVAAAFAAARYLSPALPRSMTVPLLLIAAPSAVDPLWDKFGPQLWGAVTSGGFSFDGIFGGYGVWGVLSNEGPNVGGDFLILASVAGIAAAPSLGWRLPAFLIGSAVIVKTPAGVALFAGFMLAEAWRAFVAKRLWPSSQMLTSAAAFVVTFAAFYLLSFESNFRVELFPLFHLREMVGRGRLTGIILDVLWLFLPVLIVLLAAIKDPEQRSAPILLLAVAPFLVVNTTRLDNIRAGGGGTGDDWFQILHSVPFLMHAFALSLAGRRWAVLGRPRRAAFLVVIALATAPVVIVAGHYSLQVLRDPESGNDFVDNRSLAEALAVIPTNGTIIVTNDLRYPAQHFTRDDRQMQIPALFGHQAFAVNYAHEVVEERRGLQELLQQPSWGSAILEAARTHRWTHLLIRKDYMHPAPIPLEQIHENQFYAVFRF